MVAHAEHGGAARESYVHAQMVRLRMQYMGRSHALAWIECEYAQHAKHIPVQDSVSKRFVTTGLCQCFAIKQKNISDVSRTYMHTNILF